MTRKLLIAVCFGVFAAFCAMQCYDALRPYVSGLSSQEVLWRFYRWAGWWWWGAAIVLSTIGLALMFTLSPPRNGLAVSTRILLFGGFLLHCASWGNNALGPLANMLVLAGCVLILGQVSVADIVYRRTHPQPHPSLAHRVLWFLTRDNGLTTER